MARNSEGLPGSIEVILAAVVFCDFLLGKRIYIRFVLIAQADFVDD